MVLLIIIGILGCKQDNVDKLKEQYEDPNAAEWLADYKEPKHKWGFIDKKGKIAIEIRYDDVRDYSNGVAIVNVKGKWGYIDASGKELIKPAFLDAHEFADKLALVQGFDKQYFYIDDSGKKQFNCPAKNCGDFTNGYALFSENGAFGIMDTTGKVTCPLTFIEIAPLDKGRFVALQANKYGIIDPTGKWLVQPKYTNIKSFASNLLRCKTGNKYYFLNKDLKEVLGPYDSAIDFEEDHTVVSIANQFIIMNKTGAVTYKSTNPLTNGGEGKWVETVDGKSNFIDAKGQKLYTQSFDNVYKFSNGLAGVQIGEGWGYINKKGNTIVPAELPIIWDFKENMVRFIANTGHGFIDTSGKLTIAPKYLEARDFKEGKARVSN